MRRTMCPRETRTSMMNAQSTAAIITHTLFGLSGNEEKSEDCEVCQKTDHIQEKERVFWQQLIFGHCVDIALNKNERMNKACPDPTKDAVKLILIAITTNNNIAEMIARCALPRWLVAYESKDAHFRVFVKSIKERGWMRTVNLQDKIIASAVPQPRHPDENGAPHKHLRGDLIKDYYQGLDYETLWIKEEIQIWLHSIEMIKGEDGENIQQASRRAGQHNCVIPAAPTK